MALSDKHINKRLLRDVLGCFATGVAIVTTATPGGHKMGLTVNSFSSLSLEPPLIIWCLSKSSGLADHFSKGCPFVVNFLNESQRDLAHKFATEQEDRFGGIACHDGIGGAPVLAENEGVLECQVEATHPGGDHIIIVGLVQKVAAGRGRPLLFHKGRYRTLGEDKS